jgi:hypothetical protein
VDCIRRAWNSWPVEYRFLWNGLFCHGGVYSYSEGCYKDSTRVRFSFRGMYRPPRPLAVSAPARGGRPGSRSPWAPIGRSSLVMHISNDTVNALVILYARNNAPSSVETVSAPGPLGPPAVRFSPGPPTALHIGREYHQ